MWSCAAVLGAIGLSLSGCGDVTPSNTTSPAPSTPSPAPSTCPSGATFPASSALLIATGDLSGSATASGVNMDVSGSMNMWFANHDIRQDMTFTFGAQGTSVSMTQNKIQTCSDDTAHVAAFVSAEGTAQCDTNDIPLPPMLQCSNITLFGPVENATCKDVETCPSGGGFCAVWSIPESTSFHAQLFSNARMMVLKAAKAGNLAAAMFADPTTDVYFKNGTDEVVAMKQSLTQPGVTVDLTITFSNWDTSTQVASDQFDIPSDWQPCEPQETSGLPELAAGDLAHEQSLTALQSQEKLGAEHVTAMV